MGIISEDMKGSEQLELVPARLGVIPAILGMVNRHADKILLSFSF